MSPDDIRFLKTKIDKDTVKLHCIDGEEISAKIISVSEREKDVVFDIIESNRPKKYMHKNAAYLIKFDEIASAS